MRGTQQNPMGFPRFYGIQKYPLFPFAVIQLLFMCKTRQFWQNCNASSLRMVFCYLFNGICFHIHLRVTEIPSDQLHSCTVCVTALIGLVTLICNILTFPFSSLVEARDSLRDGGTDNCVVPNSESICQKTALYCHLTWLQECDNSWVLPTCFACGHVIKH